MTDLFTILHLSDLHFTEKWSFKQKPVFRAFLKDIGELETVARPSLIIFSGDIVHNPDDGEIYLTLFELFDAAMKATALTERSVVFCPGNHDVSFAAIKTNALEYDSIQRIRDYTHEFDKEYLAGALNAYVRNINKGFFEFCELLGYPWTNPFVSLRHYEDIKMTIILINTTAACSLAGSKADRGHLVVPIPAIEEAIHSVPQGNLTITVSHHPLTDLNEVCSREVTRLIERYSTLHFFGHLHDTRPVQSISPVSQLMMLQSGPLYSDDQSIKSYQLIEVHAPSKNARALIRTYKEARSEFDIGNEISENGIFPNDKISGNFWKAHNPPIDTEGLALWLRESCLPKLEQDAGLGFDNRSLRDVYVLPPLARVVPDGADDSSINTEVIRSAITLLAGGSNAIIYVPEEFGATSLLSYTAIEAAAVPKKLSSPRIPLLVDANDIKDYRASAERVLKQAHPEIENAVFGWRSCLEDQPYLVLIDNFQLGNSRHFAAAKRLTEVLPKAQYIVAIRTQLAVAGAALPMEVELPFQHETFTLRPFNRAKVRELVRKWVLPPSFTENYVVDAVFQRFQSLSIPLSGPHISMFLTVLSTQKSFSPINASTVIENFVEALLNKTGIEKIFRNGMDFRETADLLSCIAEHFVRENVISVSEVNMLGVSEQYYKAIGIDRSGEEVMAYLRQGNVFNERATVYHFVIVYCFLILLLIG